MSTDTINQPFSVEKTGSALGVVVEGIDLRQPVNQQQFLQLQKAWNEHHILIFKNQTLTDEQLFNFATYFGDVFHPPADVPVLASDTNGDRKSTRLNSSHVRISYAVFCLKK